MTPVDLAGKLTSAIFSHSYLELDPISPSLPGSPLGNHGPQAAVGPGQAAWICRHSTRPPNVAAYEPTRALLTRSTLVAGSIASLYESWLSSYPGPPRPASLPVLRT